MADKQADDGKRSAQNVEMNKLLRGKLNRKQAESKEGATMNDMIRATLKGTEEGGNTAEDKE